MEVAPEPYEFLGEATRLPFRDYLEILPAAAAVSPASPFLLIEHMGGLTVGKDITMAFDKMEVAEYTAQSVFMAKAAGLPLRALSRQQLRRDEKAD